MIKKMEGGLFNLRDEVFDAQAAEASRIAIEILGGIEFKLEHSGFHVKDNPGAFLDPGPRPEGALPEAELVGDDWS